MTFVTKKTGVAGEDIVSNFLLKNGYKILQKNFKTKFGEIDLIAQKEDKIHFIEVKTRLSNVFAEPYESVNTKKINKIKSLISYYVKMNNFNHNKFSIDVFSVIIDKNNKIKDMKIFENITN